MIHRTLTIAILAVALAALALNATVVALLLSHHELVTAPAPAMRAVPALPTPRTPPRFGWTYARMQSLIDRGAREFGQSPAWMERIDWCESNWNPNATNAWSGAAGIAQFEWPTFDGWVGDVWFAPNTWLSPYNPRVATRLQAWMLSQGMAGQWACAYLVGMVVGGADVRRHLAHLPPGCRPPLDRTPPSCWAWLPRPAARPPRH